MIFSIAFALVFAIAAVSAANISVIVGADDQQVFNPLSVRAVDGDFINFEFFSTNLSVTESTFAAPCTRKPGGVDSGLLIPLDSNTRATWTIQILDAGQPLWFFCSQVFPEHHCIEGMVFAINDNEEQPFSTFQSTAKTSTIDSLTDSQDAAPIPGATEPRASGAPGSPISVGPISIIAIAQPTATGQGSTNTSPNSATGAHSLNMAGAVSVVSLIVAVTCGLMF